MKKLNDILNNKVFEQEDIGEKPIIVEDDFCRMFDCKPAELPKQLISGLNRMNTRYRKLTHKEFEEYVLYVLKIIANPSIRRTREENLKAFETGWSENLELLVSQGISLENLKPKYFYPTKFLRYNNRLIITESPNFEYDLFTLVRYLLFVKYLSQHNDIYEIGCGSCQNLFLLSELFPSKSLYGLDWTEASVKIAKYLAGKLNRNIYGAIFDMMNPPRDVVIKPGSAVITIHSLEQIGTQHEKLLEFIIDANPAIVLHYEPILEFFDENNLLDYLAIMFSKKRNYLNGFMSALTALEKQGKIEILKAKRPYLGGVIHESSLVIWRPIKKNNYSSE